VEAKAAGGGQTNGRIKAKIWQKKAKWVFFLIFNRLFRGQVFAIMVKGDL
jgi:hypothetical protein